VAAVHELEMTTPPGDAMIQQYCAIACRIINKSISQFNTITLRAYIISQHHTTSPAICFTVDSQSMTSMTLLTRSAWQSH